MNQTAQDEAAAGGQCAGALLLEGVFSRGEVGGTCGSGMTNRLWRTTFWRVCLPVCRFKETHETGGVNGTSVINASLTVVWGCVLCVLWYGGWRDVVIRFASKQDIAMTFCDDEGVVVLRLWCACIVCGFM